MKTRSGNFIHDQNVMERIMHIAVTDAVLENHLFHLLRPHEKTANTKSSIHFICFSIYTHTSKDNDIV